MTPKLLSAEEVRSTRKALHALGGWRETDRLDAHIAALEADNAALLWALHKTCLRCLGAYESYSREDGLGVVVGRCRMPVHAIAKGARPGAHLLAEHAKALVQAKNEGLEKAIATLRARKDVAVEMGHVDRAYTLINARVAVEALKEPES